MELEQHQQDWEDLAAVDLYWSILSDPHKRGARWSPDDFFASGRAEIEATLARTAELGRSKRRRTALDFGCGAGRLTRALAGKFDDVVGVDISAGMVEEARRLNADVPGCRFVLNTRPDLSVFEAGSFDFVYSSIVLQHLPRRHVRPYLCELVRVTAPGGLLAFQLISSLPLRNRIQLRRRLYHLVRRFGAPPSSLYRLRLQPIAITFLSAADVTRHLRASGAEVLAADTVDVGGGVRSTTYYAGVGDAR